ncbi:hypothetical protein GHT06_019959 [Daphnia sinensis]|uniref:Ionotropic glutamate receptor C-terminal domain-containing protein n=1 Tax=Daphnia sinensis TaxID=1820382 RepID=A0AAD5PR31_9CRUS|nr:hypothetical protein GHT06_019959 [Daphnia sinensis]
MKLTWMQLIAFVRIVHLSSALKERVVPSTNDGPSQKDKLHLRIAQIEYSASVLFLRRTPGHESSQFGFFPLILDWLSLRYKFDYTIFVDKNVSIMVEDRAPHQPGAFIYILSGAREVITSAIEPLGSPSRLVDFVHPFSYSRLCFLIPMPEASQNNVDAVIKPFQFWVWIALGVAAGAVLVVLHCFNLFLTTKERYLVKEKDTTNANRNIVVYLLATLLNQGGYVSCILTSIRMIIGAWCLLSLVLVNSYNSTLISYVTATRLAMPLVNSMEELAHDSNVHLVVDRGQGPDSLFSAAQSGLFQALGDKLRAYPHSKCSSTKQCVDMVKSTPPRHVYVNSDLALLAVLKQEYQTTRKCNLAIGGELRKDFALVWGLSKGSPYLEAFNRGTLTLHEFGLILFWDKKLKPDIRPCSSQVKDYRVVKKKKIQRVRLKLSNLTGAYAVLAVGYSISLLTFLVEKIVRPFWMAK